MSVKLYNRGKRHINGKTMDGKNLPFTFRPETAIEFDDVTGKNLKRLYKHELLSMDDVQKQFDGSTAPVKPDVGRPAMNHEESVKVEPVPQTTDLSDIELAAIRSMRTGNAQPVAEEDSSVTDEVNVSAEVADDKAEEKAPSLMERVKSRLS